MYSAEFVRGNTKKQQVSNMNPINPELIRSIAEGINIDDIPVAGIAQPSLNNGISPELRELFSNDEEFISGVNEVLSVLN